MTGIIEIEGMSFYAFHGHYTEEQVVGNQFLVDLYIETDHIKAVDTDLIEDALNYQTAYKIVASQMSVSSALLEHVAGRILEALFAEFSGIVSARVKVSKLNPPMGGKIEKVSLTLTRNR